MPQATHLFAKIVTDFFEKHLTEIKGVSPNTITNYRDTMKLLLRYITNNGIPIEKIELNTFSSELILHFLDYLELKRSNSTSTRNIRLAAIHCFFKYVAFREPQSIFLCQQILNIPFKRTISREVEYFEYNEIEQILQIIDKSSLWGLRDYALIIFMFNTGARAQEVVDVAISDIQFLSPYSVHIIGKGRKERTCPLWKNTVNAIQQYLNAMRAAKLSHQNLFINHSGVAMTRFGVRYILSKYTNLATKKIVSLKDKRLHPHSMRHSTGVYMLKSGNDLSSIANWLGHSSPTTTNRYATMDIEMKRQILETLIPPNSVQQQDWSEDKDLLDWLERL